MFVLVGFAQTACAGPRCVSSALRVTSANRPWRAQKTPVERALGSSLWRYAAQGASVILQPLRLVDTHCELCRKPCLPTAPGRIWFSQDVTPIINSKESKAIFMVHPWQDYFDQFAPHYNGEPYTANTAAEVAFILEQLQLKPGMSVLDVGCGTGRHAVALAQRGLTVTGLDISTGMLQQAQQAAETAKVSITWVQGDAAEVRLAQRFDAAISVCEGAMSLLGTHDDPLEHDLRIVQNVFAMLKVGGRFLVTVSNGMRYLRMYGQEDVDAGRFDPLTMTEHFTVDVGAAPARTSRPVRSRGYVPTEFTLLLRSAGFAVEYVGGGTAGYWEIRPPDLDEMELLAIARKPA